MLSVELKYMKKDDFEKLRDKVVEVRKMLNGLINSLRGRA